MKLLLEKLGVVMVDKILKHCLLGYFEAHTVTKVTLPFLEIVVKEARTCYMILSQYFLVLAVAVDGMITSSKNVSS